LRGAAALHVASLSVAMPVRLLDYGLGYLVARLAMPAGKRLPRACVSRAMLPACNLR
jgi:hypothetical protein